MQVDQATIRERYLLLSTEQLQHIVDAPGDDYTPDAKTVAQAILATRRFEPPPAVSPEPATPQVKKSEGMAVLGSMAVAGHMSRAVFQAYQVADKQPNMFRAVVRDLADDPWTYALAIATVIYLWRRRR